MIRTKHRKRGTLTITSGRPLVEVYEEQHNYDQAGKYRNMKGIPRTANLSIPKPNLACSKPLTCGSAEVLQVLKKSIAKNRASRGSDYAKILGSEHGGWVVLETDGHRALLAPGTSENKLNLDYMHVPRKHGITIQDPQAYLAIQRLTAAQKAIGPTRKTDILPPCIGIGIHTKLGRLTLFTGTDKPRMKKDAKGNKFCDQDPGYCWGKETGIPCRVRNGGRPVTLHLNANYLLDALGCWPVTLSWDSAESAVWIEPPDKTWRYVVMPIRR